MTEIHDLPGKTEYGGYLYVIDFDNDVVKVGATANPRARNESHVRSAAVFGVAVRGHWLSPLHEDYFKMEGWLLSEIAQAGGVHVGRETFTGIRFSDAVEVASRLDYKPFDFAAAKARVQERLAAFHAWLRHARAHDEALKPPPRRSFDAVHWGASGFFGVNPDGSYDLPDDPDRELIPDELIEEMAEKSGRSVDDVMEMDFIDLLEGAAVAAVRTQALYLRIFVREAGRWDLEESIAEVRYRHRTADHGDLTPTRAIQEATPMTTTHTRRTVLAVRSEDCYENLNLGAVRRFVAECDALRLDDVETVSVEDHGDDLHRLVVESVDYEELEPPTADNDSVAGIERIVALCDAAQAAVAEQQRAGGAA